MPHATKFMPFRTFTRAAMPIYNIMRNPHIVFIDDGITCTHFSFNLINDIEVINREINSRKSKNDDFSHGTTCAAIVQRYYSSFDCTSIKILDNNRSGTIDSLDCALSWCLENTPDIVNMSVGSTDFRDASKIRYLINKLSLKTILVAAQSNAGFVTYPASFSGVIGVKASADKVCHFTPQQIDGIEFEAPGEHELVTRYGESIMTSRANSYAAPFIVAQICQKIEQVKDTSTARNLLISMQEKPNLLSTSLMPDWINSALIVYDCNAVYDLYPFSIHDVISLNDDIQQIMARIRQAKIDTVIVLMNDDNFSHKVLMILKEVEHQEKSIALVANTSYFDAQFKLKNYWNSCDVNCLLDSKCSFSELPKVLICGSNINRLSGITCSLIKYFHNDGYHGLAYSNIKGSQLFGMFALPSKNCLNFLNRMGYEHKGDIHICCWHTDMLCSQKDLFSDLNFFDFDIAFDLESNISYSIDEGSIQQEEHLAFTSGYEMYLYIKAILKD